MRAIALTLLSFTALTALGDVAGKRPNIIFLMDDQRRWDALGCVDPAIKTPALDRLAKEGILFDQAVCQAPMCVPSRYSMMLGLYPHQAGILSNGPGLSDTQLPCDTLPELLRKAGYQTAGFGKTHWSRSSPATPQATTARRCTARSGARQPPSSGSRWSCATGPTAPGSTACSAA
jgi:arylsulfatase A-like enzyme